MPQPRREVDAPDTAHSAIITDHEYVPTDRLLCGHENQEGKVCRLSEAAHFAGERPVDDPGRPPSMRGDFDHEEDSKKVQEYIERSQPLAPITKEQIDKIMGEERIFPGPRPEAAKEPSEDPERPREEILQVEGHKDDKGKNATFYIPHRAKQAVGNVMAFGAVKYAPGNYLMGMKGSRLWNAAGRHMDDWAMGKELDEESNESPLANAVCCLLMLLELEINGTLEDDRIDPALFNR